MSIGRLVTVVIGALIAGFFVGVILSGEDNVSAAAWIGTAAVVIVAETMRQMLTTASVDLNPIIPAWRKTSVTVTTPEAEDFKALRSAVLGGLARGSSFERSLQPRLETLASHYLPTRHGLDPSLERERYREVLGDLAWMIEDITEERSPTAEELERFLDIVVGEGALSR